MTFSVESINGYPVLYVRNCDKSLTVIGERDGMSFVMTLDRSVRRELANEKRRETNYARYGRAAARRSFRGER